MNNLFLAVYPRADDAAAMAQLAERTREAHQLDGDLRKPIHLHVTLVEFSDVKEPSQNIRDKAVAAAATIVMPAFDVVFDRLLSFSGAARNKPLVLTSGDGVAGLIALQQALIRALHKQWLKIPANPRYTPHMTLLYATRSIAEQAIPPIGWRVGEFALTHSLAGHGKHEILGRWPLRPIAPAP